MVIKNKIFALLSSITITFVSLASLNHPNAYAEEIPPRKIPVLTIYNPSKSYVLTLSPEQGKKAAQLIKQKFSHEDLIIWQCKNR